MRSRGGLGMTDPTGQQLASGRERCRTCGKSVDTDVGRVCGDNDNNLPVCARCYETPDNCSYASDVRAVDAYLVGSGHRRAEFDGDGEVGRAARDDDRVAAGAGGIVPGGWSA